ncbi:MAG: hypothetical protein QGG40_02355 [Myxococcota bacterium]|jgi:hypothetical protein|nr:hypothetical protein [Myxococcota bacterium]
MSIPLLIPLLLVSGCKKDPRDTGPAETGDTDDGIVTYYDDVRPILTEHCIGCHGLASEDPPSLADYASAAERSMMISSYTASGYMPKWPASDDCLELKNERALTEEQISTLQDWHNGGAIEGEYTGETGTDAWDSSEWDVAVGAIGAYTPSAFGDDEYICFSLDPGLDEDIHVTDYRVYPGNLGIVHHVLLFVDEEGASLDQVTDDDLDSYECYSGPGVEADVFGGWVPGMKGVTLPEGTGFLVPAGSRIIMQIHYHPENDPGGEDQTQVGLITGEVDQRMFFERIRPATVSIPPDTTGHSETGELELDEEVDITVHAMAPHMHELGASTSLTWTPQGGDEECLIEIPEWDFEDQQLYWTTEGKILDGGGTLTVECIYDNTTGSTVTWGEETEDEMCLTYVAYTVNE